MNTDNVDFNLQRMLPYLLIIGAPKAGTTSLFNYLSNHPEISPCEVKEPGFFYPHDGYEDSELRYGRDPIGAYFLKYPQATAGKVRLEGTAMYFKYSNMAADIHEELPNSKILISLREPISRIVSFYQMGVYGGWVNPGISFDEVVTRMLNWNPDYHVGIRLLLEEGYYSKHLPVWIDTFKSENVLAIWFDDIKKAPSATMKKICEFISIDPDYYDDFVFSQDLRAKKFKSVYLGQNYRALKRNIKLLIQSNTYLYNFFRYISRTLSPGFENMISEPAGPLKISANNFSALQKYYSDDIPGLESLIGAEVPWAKMYRNNDFSKSSLSSKLLII